MRKHLQYTLLILLLFVCGCTNNNRVEKEIRDLYGKEIVFPEEYTFMGSNNMSNADIIFEKDVKIVTYIEDFQCTSCIYKMVVEWSDQIRSIFKDDVYYVVVMSSEDKEQLEELFRNHPIGASIFLYENSIFGVKNDLDIVLSRNRTFMLNKQNRIVVVGEPFDDEKKWAVYKKAYNILRKE